MITASEYNERRQKVLEEMQTNSIMILFAGCELKSSADECFSLAVNTNFYYLTGIKQANSVLVLYKFSKTRTRSVLIVNEIDPYKVKWYGRMISKDDAKTVSGCDEVVTFKNGENFEELNEIKKLGKIKEFKNVYLDLEAHNFITMDLTTVQYGEQFKNSKIIDAFPLIIKFRMIKSPAEIEEIKASIEVTRIGLDAVLKNMKPNQFEYQMASLFEYTIRNHNNSGLSFPTIAASGDNAVILHYPTPDDVLRDNTLLLLDLGAEKNMYRADISRTYPVNGHFNDQQREIYEIVLRCNRAVQGYMRPGVTLKDCQEFTFDFLKAELINRGYISCTKAREDSVIEIQKAEKELGRTLDEKEQNELYQKCLNAQVYKYYYHSVSHHLGLDVHDQSVRGAKLEPGMVITDEPGLYFAEYGIGVRIEDDILITEDGSINLSECIIKDVELIEKAMKN